MMTEAEGQEALRLLSTITAFPLVMAALQRVTDGLEDGIGTDVLVGTVRAVAEYMKAENPTLWSDVDHVMQVLGWICEKAVEQREERSHVN